MVEQHQPINQLRLALTDRGQFAAMAMQGIVSDPTDMVDEIRTKLVPSGFFADGKTVQYTKVPDETCAECVARLAVEYADALINRLDSTTSK